MKRMRWLASLALVGLVAAACGAAQEVAESDGGTVEERAVTVEDVVTDDDDDDGEEDAEEGDDEDVDADDDDDDAGDDPVEAEAIEFAADFGVTDDTIRVGLSADLTGDFAGLAEPIVDAQRAYFDRLNENGGIAGRDVELVILDNGFDIPTHLDNYAALSEESDAGVVMISQSTGSPHTSAIAEQLVADDLIAIPLSWYSGWADAELGSNVFELHTNYCFESMNGVEFLLEQSDVEDPTLAILSLPGEYGRDGATGAKLAAAELGIEVVFDGEAQVVPGGDDFTAVVSQLVATDPDIVWITADANALAQILGGAAAQDLDALWSGNQPTYNPVLLGTDVGPAIEQFYFASSYTALWGSNDSPGMQDIMSELQDRLPGGTYAVADSYVFGWTEAIFTEAVLRQAAANGDMTRAGVVAAANEVTVDFQGLAPDQSWAGDPNDFIVRGSFIYEIDASTATLNTSITQPGSAGYSLVRENFVGTVAAAHDYDQPCLPTEG